jgi:hypothetical protein
MPIAIQGDGNELHFAGRSSVELLRQMMPGIRTRGGASDSGVHPTAASGPDSPLVMVFNVAFGAEDEHLTAGSLVDIEFQSLRGSRILKIKANVINEMVNAGISTQLLPPEGI